MELEETAPAFPHPDPETATGKVFITFFFPGENLKNEYFSRFYYVGLRGEM